MNREFERQVAREVCSVVECCIPNRDRRVTRAFELKPDSSQRLKILHHLYVRYGFVMRESEILHMRTAGDVTSWYTRRADKLQKFSEYLDYIAERLRARNVISSDTSVKFSSQLREHQRPFDLGVSREAHVRLITDLVEAYNTPAEALSQAKTTAELCEVLYEYRGLSHASSEGPSSISSADALLVVRILGRYRLAIELIYPPADEGELNKSRSELAVYSPITKNSAREWVPFNPLEVGSYERALLQSARSWLRLNRMENGS